MASSIIVTVEDAMPRNWQIGDSIRIEVLDDVYGGYANPFNGATGTIVGIEDSMAFITGYTRDGEYIDGKPFYIHRLRKNGHRLKVRINA